nr:ribonuclease H-like domain-containing protein [Tanacetum cinerariifolium]
MINLIGKNGDKELFEIGFTALMLSMRHQAGGPFELWIYPMCRKNFVPQNVDGIDRPDHVGLTSLDNDIVYWDRKRNVARYNEFRRSILLIPISKWEDLMDDQEAIETLHEVYDHDEAPHTLSTIKLPILKKGEYDIWAIKMEHYLEHTDYPIWEVIQKGNGPVQVSTDTYGQIRVLPPKTAEEILAKERERKARTTLLMAIPEDHLAKFHKISNAKEMWGAIKSRFSRNDESKKMQKYILKQQFECLSVSNLEGLHKCYDMFQSLLSQLETLGAGVSTEDANQKFLRSLPSSWSQVSLITKTKPGVDTLSFDDLYNNLRVFESDVKGSTTSSSSTQNVAFVSSDSTSSTNEVNTAYDHKDLEQLDDFDLEKIDLKWQVAMISIRLKKFYKKIWRKLHFNAKEPVGFDKTKVESLNCHNTGYFARECISKGNQESRRRDAGNYGHKARYNRRRPAKQDEPKAMVTIDREGVDWTGHAEDNTENYALMAFNSSNSGSNTKVTSCSKECEKTYAKLKKLYDKQREQLGDASIEIQAYTLALKKLEAQLVCHQKNQLAYEEKISDLASCESNSCVKTLESMPKPVGSKPKAVSKPKVWSDSPIIEEYELDSDDEYVFKATMKQEIPSCASINTVKHVKSPRQTVKDQDTFLVIFFRDYDFHEKITAKQVELNKRKNKVTCQRNDRAVWNNVQRLNHKNKFVPTSILTKTGRFPVNAVRQKFSSQATSTSTVRKVNNARYIVNEIRPRNNVYKSHSPIIMPFNRTTTPKSNFVNHKVNTAEDKTVSTVGGNRETAVKASAGCNWRSKRHYWNKDNPHQNLKGKSIADSGCLRHMTGNKAYLVKYHDFNGGPVSFGGSIGQVTSKGKIQTGKLDFEDVYFVKELQHFNLFYVSQVCDIKNKVLFTDTEFLMLSPDFKLPDENQVLLRVPRQNNMYSFNLENIVPSGDLDCLIVKATVNESNKWHRRLGHLVTAENKSNKTAGPKDANNSAGTQDNNDAGNSKMEAEHALKYFVLPLWSSYTSTVKSSEAKNGDQKLNGDTGTKDLLLQEGAARASSTNYVNTASTPVNTASTLINTASTPVNTASTPVNTASTPVPSLQDIYEVPNDGIFTSASYDAESAVADFTNLESTVNASPIPQSRIHSIHATTQILGDPNSAVQTKSKVNKSSGAHAFVYKIKKDERGVVVRNKARLISQGHRQEERIDYDEVFAPMARSESIGIFLAFASYMGFIVYQIDVKSAFLYGKIDEEIQKRNHRQDSIYKEGQEGYHVKQREDDIFISQDKYVVEILKEFNFMSVKTGSTPVETKKPLVKDAKAADVDVHLYRSMIGSLMYLTALKPDIMYAVCGCSRESSFDQEAYSDSDYARANLDKKSTT